MKVIMSIGLFIIFVIFNVLSDLYIKRKHLIIFVQSCVSECGLPVEEIKVN